MKIVILSIFPGYFSGFLDSSLIGKARAKGALEITLIDLRTFAEPPHFQVDDSPYGGGAGMVMKPEPLVHAVEAQKSALPGAKVILLTPSGTRFTQEMAHNLAEQRELILICGRYEGIDQRVIDLIVDEEVSIGDYVLMGGEAAAIVLLEASVRLIPDVIGNRQSIDSESFGIVHAGHRLLEGPQYTRPPEFRGLKVPDILLSGDHRRISEWRLEEALAKTARVRPDLIEKR